MNTLAKNNQQQHPLNWIKPELENTIKTVRDLFESYSQELDDDAPIEKIRAELHLLHGSFEMLNLYGAALLVADMKKAIDAIQGDSKKNKEDIFEALLHATLTLETFIDKLNVSNNGIPTSLLLIINDLRASIKEPLLSESSLFSPNLSIIPKIPLHTHSKEQMGARLKNYAAKLRPYYQAALLSWFRNPSDQLSLQQLCLVARNFEFACLTPRNRQIWWILGGLFEAMRDQGLSSNIALRLILGEADRVIKSFSQGDTNIYEQTPPIELLKNALYYISQANSDGERVRALKEIYQLENITPSEEEISLLQHGNNAPSSETFTLIANELSKSLEQVKATIENFVRNTQDNPIRLKQTITPLKHISDTLSLLNLGEEKQKLQEQADIISEIIITNKAPSNDTMLEIAAAILHVETSLKNIGKAGPKTSNAINLELATPAVNSELIKITEKTALEAQGNIAQIKNCIMAYLASNQTQKNMLTNITKLLTEIKGCLIILNNEQASKIANALLEYVQNEIIDNEESLPSGNLDILAETIVSLEYYFETVMDSNVSTDPIIEMARISINKLGFSIPAVAKPIINDITDDTINIHDITPNAIKRLQKKEELRFPRKIKNNPNDNNIIALNAESIDDEIAEIFIDEAIEELELMRNNLRTLQLSMDDSTTLTSVRKTLHTLKGSGRIAGAMHISELSSTLNDYLSRIMCGALDVNQETVSILEESHKLMLELIECFKDRASPPSAFNKIIATVKEIIGPTPEPPKNIPKLSKVIPITRNIKNANIKELDNAVQTDLEQRPTDKAQELLQVSINQVGIIDSFALAPDKRNCEPPSQDELLTAISTLRECAVLSKAREFIHTTDLLSKYISNISKKNGDLGSEALEILKEFCTTTREILFDLSLTLHASDITGNIPSAINEITEQTLDTNSSATKQDALINTEHQALPGPEKSNSKDNETFSTKNEVDTIAKPHHENNTSEEFNEDLIDIFMEEAVELIESANNIVDEYDSDNDSKKLYTAIQRVLHTIKGSARMAGVMYVGDLSHMLETKIESISSKRISHPDNLIEIIQSCFDSINDTIEDIRSGKQITRDQNLLDKLSSNNPQVYQDDTKDNKTKSTDSPNEKDVDTKPQALTTNNPLDSSEDIESNSDEYVKAINAENSTARINYSNDSTIDTPSSKTKTEDTKNKRLEENTKSKITNPNENTNHVDEKDGLKSNNKKSGSVKVDANILDTLVNQASEENAISNRIEDHISTIKSNLFEMDKTVARALTQMRDLQFEAYNLAEQHSKVSDQFDMDTELNLSTFSEGQKITQRLMESFGDIESLHGLLTRLTLETDTLVLQQKKIHSELQENLLGTRMVTFSVQTQRMQRILRQTCISLRKKAKLTLEGTDGSVDRSVLETLMGPMEHIIRNAAAHGIEAPIQRKKLNKREAGAVHIKFSKDRSEHLIEISDDGAGIDLDCVKRKALAEGLITAEDELSDDELCNLIFKPGFSTCDEVSQISGRGVGMDVAINEIRQLGGSLSVSSTPSEGSKFIIRLPFTVSSNHTLFVKVGKNTYALPSNMIEHTISISQEDLKKLYDNHSPSYHFSNRDYPLWNMESLLNNEPIHLPQKHIECHIVLLRNGASLIALQVDEINESRDSVLKPASPQLSNIRGIAGATVLGNGKVVLIIDVPSLILYAESRDNKPSEIIYASDDDGETIKALVVDDSITVRKVTERFLNRHNIKSYTAIDGVDALNVLENMTPDIMLIDIEMPNMDGLELAQRVRADDKLKNTPIIMITSRTGNQHRETAQEIGVNTFLPKPYQEAELIENIQSLTGKQILALS